MASCIQSHGLHLLELMHILGAFGGFDSLTFAIGYLDVFHFEDLHGGHGLVSFLLIDIGWISSCSSPRLITSILHINILL